MFKVTWGCNGEPPIGSVVCDTRENAEALRERLPYPVVTVVRTDAPEDHSAFVTTWDREMQRPMSVSRAADELSRVSPFVQRALAGALPAKVTR